MQKGEFMSQRVLPGLIKRACEKHGIGCEFFSDEWFARLERPGKTAWVCGYKFDLNLSGAATVAQDKVATYLALQATGIAAVPHVLARTYGMVVASVNELHDALGTTGKVVIKPLDGSGGRGVELCVSSTEALKQIAASPEPTWAISPWLDLVCETRLITLDSHVLLAYEKHNPATIGDLKMFNLAHGATPVNVQPSRKLQDIAAEACRTLSLRLAAVDVVRTREGDEFVLEVNDGITMEHYARRSPANAQRAESIYETIVTRMMD